MSSTQLAITHVSASQNQKEVTINAAINALDDAVNRGLDVSVAAASATLTNAQFRGQGVFRVTGATVAGRTVTVPAIARVFQVRSDAANTQPISVVRGATSISVAVGETVIFRTDGTANGLFVASRSAITFQSLADTPATYTGIGGRGLRVNAGETGVEAAGRNNLLATTDPGAGTDSTQGYEAGSLKLNIVTGRLFVCTDATPAAAVWRVLEGGGQPVAVADFRSGGLPPGVTFTRNSAATVWDSLGRLLEVPSGIARFDHVAATRVPLGLLIEGETTNLITHPRSIAQAGWTNTNIASVTAVAALNGLNDAVQMGENSTTLARLTTNPVSFTSGLEYVLSGVFAPGTRGFVQLLCGSAAFGSNALWQNFDLNTGALGSGGPDNTTAGVEILSSGWIRCWAAGVATATAASVAAVHMIQNNSTARGASYLGASLNIIASFAQCEQRAGGPSSITLPAVSSPGASTRLAETVTLAVPNGTYDIRVCDREGGEWRTSQVVTGGAYTITPRSGRRHVRLVEVYAVGAAAATPGLARAE